MYEAVGVKHPKHQIVSRRKEMGTVITATLVSALATLIGLIILAWSILFITKGRFLKPYFERYASEQTQRDVKVAGDFQLYLNPINVKFRAEGLTISNPSWAKKKNLFESKVIDTNIASIPLIFGDRRVNWLNLLNGDLDLEWDAKGQRNTWTFGDPNQPGKPFDMPDIRRALVAGSHLTYRAPQLQLLAQVEIDTVRASDLQVESDIRFHGGGTMRARPFTLSGSLQTPNETVRGGRNRVSLHAAGAGNVMDVSGTLPAPTVIEGADLKMHVRGGNLASLFDFLGTAIPATRTYNFTSNLTKQDDWWRFTGLRGRFGDSDLAGRMSIGMPKNRLKIDADLRSRVLDIIDAGPWIGYNPERLDRMGARGAIVSDGGRPRVLPDATLRVEALKTFDAHLDYRVTRVRMDNFPVSNIEMVLDLDHNLLKLSPLNFDLAGGHLASDIIINARVPAVITDYDIRLSPTPMGILLAKFGVADSGTTGLIKARVQLRGVGDSVHKSLSTSNGRIAFIIPAGSMWARNIQGVELDFGTFLQKMWQKKLKEPVAINCGLLAFTVRNGIGTADPILIDTKKNVIGGKGAFSFANEAMDFKIQADAKTFSLLSAQSPIRVQGYFVSPHINIISPELIARGAAGLGLGIFVNPFASILAFVDPGNAEDTACGPVLAGARAYQQREVDGGRVKHIGQGQPQTVKAKKKKKFLGIIKL
jgi:uncharacterized protein involved in outer membrane biogenesis